jgi:hypothetical protein
LIFSFSCVCCIRIIIYLYKMAACSNLLAMKFDENEDYEINWELKN